MHLLFVANFASDTGYAWETIETVFRRAAERLVRDGHRVTVCYASLADGPPPRMQGAPFGFVEFDYASTATVAGTRAFARLLRSLRAEALYLTDRPTWSWRYAAYRAAGVRHILVHDRTSGERTRRGPLARAAKRTLHALPLVAADACIAVSDFVRRRLVEVNGVPPARVFRVHNGIDLARFDGADPGLLHRVLGVEPETRVVFCAGRMQPYKGFQVVVAAAARLRDAGVRDVAFACCGGGPYLDDLRAQAAAAELGGSFHFLGERGDVARLLPGAAVAVVPSLWAEAFGLAVVEAMAAGVPLVASRTGGIPELVRDGETGVLVEPGDDAALAAALRALLDDPGLRAALARAGAAEARRRFGLERCASELYAVTASLLPTAPSTLPLRLAGK